jgi:hypothetical protein
MLLTVIYISIYLLTSGLFFLNSRYKGKYRNPLMLIHFTLFVLLILDFFFINFRGVWFDRIIVLMFLSTGSAIFCLYLRTLRFPGKVYFGFFFTYPLFLVFAFLADRLFFVVVGGPLILSLIIPENNCSDAQYDVREKIGLIAPKRLQLIRKEFITEKVIGTCSDEDIVWLKISAISIIKETGGTIQVMLKTRDKQVPAVFEKNP